MADKPKQKPENAEQTEVKNVEGVPLTSVASLSVPTIISALHQKALKETNAASKGAKIINSALEEGKDKITSAGEHIISAIPVDKDKVLEKKVAIELLKTYVQWFVGPDLAKKVDDSTVKSLLEAPGAEKKEPKDKKNESKKFMSFEQYLLLEVDGKEQLSEDADVPDLDAPDDREKEGSNKKDDDKKDDDKKDDENKDKNVGYYIAYNLKVESGLPQKALKDSMKKFAKTFFDDVKFTASGLFGGGDSFTVKDVKDKWNEVFGPIDPDELENNVEKEINKIRHPNTPPPEVDIRDKDTLVQDLGDNIDGNQKKAINAAKYSLWIKLAEDDPKKPLFNTRVIADIVTGSIKGLFKKFKNKITKNDVICLKNYQDIHGDAKAIQKLNHEVPIPSQVRDAIAKADSYNKAIKNLDQLFDKIDKQTRLIDKSPFAKTLLTIWKNYKNAFEKDPDCKDTTKITGDDKHRQEVLDKKFKKFKDEYDKKYNEIKKSENVYEASIVKRLANPFNLIKCVKKTILESWLKEDGEPDFDAPDDREKEDSEKKDDGSKDGDKKDGNKQDDVDIVKNIKTHAPRVFKNIDGKKPTVIQIGNVDKLASMLSIYGNESSIKEKFKDKDKDFKNGIVVSFGDNLQIKSLDESQMIKDQIMSILFEGDKEGKDKESKDTESKDNKPEGSNMPAEKSVRAAFDLLRNKAKLKPEQYGEVYAFTYGSTTLSEADDSSDDSKNTVNMKNVKDAFQTKLTDIAKSESGKSTNPIVFVGPIDEVKNKLAIHSLGNSKFDSYKDKFQYVAVHLPKMPDEKQFPGIKGNKASPGYKSFTKEKTINALKESLKDKAKREIDGDFEFLQYKKTADNVKGDKNRGYRYNDTQIPAKFSVRAIFFNVKESSGGGPDPNPKPREDSPETYLMPFGGEEVTDTTDVDVEDVDVEDTKVVSEDLYIVPIPNMNYKDKEYDTYA